MIREVFDINSLKKDVIDVATKFEEKTIFDKDAQHVIDNLKDEKNFRIGSSKNHAFLTQRGELVLIGSVIVQLDEQTKSKSIF